MFGDKSPIEFRFAQILVPQMFVNASGRVNWTVKIEVNVPAAWFAFLKQKMQHHGRAIGFIKAAARVVVISEAAGKVRALR
jgi:hypothetical protein